jgi:tetratricopeptide (TPR) repeat protein
LSEQKKSKSTLDAIDRDRKQAQAWAEYSEGKKDHAISLLRSIADKSSGVYQASDQIPAREMLADMLLEMNRPADALAEYQADLKTNPNRFDSLYGAARAAQQGGQSGKASDYFAQLVKNCEASNSERPELTEAKVWLAKQPNVNAKK